MGLGELGKALVGERDGRNRREDICVLQGIGKSSENMESPVKVAGKKLGAEETQNA
jgi:hypothetical protein